MTQKEKQSQKEQMELAMNAIGVMAEMSLAFFRDALQAGGTIAEAMTLTRVFIAANMKDGNEPPKEEE